MNIDLKKTLAQIEDNLVGDGLPDIGQLHKMYDLSLRLQSQILAVIRDLESFSPLSEQERLAAVHCAGCNINGVLTLTLREPLPAMKRLTEAIEEHWKDMIHSAIWQAAQQGPPPYFEKAFVEIEIVTPKGSNNVRVWDTSNRAINVVINNLKGIFFHDDDMEHMAFSVVGRWGEEGVTTPFGSLILTSTSRAESTNYSSFEDFSMTL